MVTEQKYITVAELFGDPLSEKKMAELVSRLGKIPALREYVTNLAKVKNVQKRAESLAGIYLLFQMTDLSKKELVRAKSGKPCLSGGPEFNISHSFGFAVCVTDAEPLGVDTELLRRVDNAERLAERYFSDGEREKALSSADRDREFLKIWTKKEACLKLTGEGLTVDMCSVDTESMGLIFEESEVVLGDKTYLITVCKN